MRGTFLESDSFTNNSNFCFVGIAYCSADYLKGVEEASYSIRELSYRYANADGTSSPLKVFNPEKGYILKDVIIRDAGTVVAADRKELGEGLNSLAIDKSEVPIFVGGDHSVTYETVRRVCDEETVVVQFDAHSDYIDEFEEYPHGSVMNAVGKLDNVKKIIHFGLRGNLNSGPAINQSVKDGNDVIIGKRIEEDLYKALNAVRKKNIYITFDVDFLNPMVAPATNCPEPGGLGYEKTLEYLERIIRASKKVVGLDFVEYNPTLEGSNVTGITLVNIIMEAMNYINSKETG